MTEPISQDPTRDIPHNRGKEHDTLRASEVLFPEGSVGIATRAKNNPCQDNHYKNRLRGRFFVYDGLTESRDGANAANVASTATDELTDSQSPVNSEQDAKDKMSAVLPFINDAVFESPEGGLTTAVGVQFFEIDGKKKAVIVRAGDSRAYHQDKETGKLTLHTDDDDILTEAFDDPIDAQALRAKLDNATSIHELDVPRILDHGIPIRSKLFGQVSTTYKKELTEAEIFSQMGGVANSLGQVPSSERTFDEPIIIDVKSGDLFLLCSDGLLNLPTKRINEIMKQYADDPVGGAEALATEAETVSRQKPTDDNIRPNPDDIKIILVKVP